MKRTTIELDEDLVARAKVALGKSTTRDTVHEALRRAADGADADLADRAKRQLEYLDHLVDRVDIEVLASEEMWR